MGPDSAPRAARRLELCRTESYPASRDDPYRARNPGVEFELLATGRREEDREKDKSRLTTRSSVWHE
jgi:hypothetical protein